MIKRDVQIEPGKTTDLGTVTALRGRRLAGKVVDSTGAPVAGAKIKVGEMLFSAEGAGRPGRELREHGRNSLGDLRPGRRVR